MMHLLDQNSSCKGERKDEGHEGEQSIHFFQIVESAFFKPRSSGRANKRTSGVPEFQIGPWHMGQNNKEMKIAEEIGALGCFEKCFILFRSSRPSKELLLAFGA